MSNFLQVLSEGILVFPLFLFNTELQPPKAQTSVAVFTTQKDIREISTP